MQLQYQYLDYLVDPCSQGTYKTLQRYDLYTMKIKKM